MGKKFWVNKKIVVTGGGGFLGKHVVGKLLGKGIPQKDIIIPRSEDYDLRKEKDCAELVKNADIVIHLAANVGGIGYNLKNPGTLFYDNILMGVHMLEEARKAGVRKFVSIGTVCAYPKYTPVPFKEEYLWDGYPEETNAPYGLAKKMLLVQGTAYRQQYGFKTIHLIPVNLYGPGDKFGPSRSHVIPALIKKVADAKKKRKNHITIWGTGKATREFLYVEDAAEGIVSATEHYEKTDPVNLGSGMEITVKELAELICKFMNYRGKICWDTSKPDGQPRRCLDISMAKKEFNFQAKVDFVEGLKKTIAWYENLCLYCRPAQDRKVMKV